ncbi:PAS domain S-box protein [uncultured Desulfuromusa sp.]|uniref:PAS domain-containing hybrid sensor histidine kinase/response regulator n=1 Tax=uncultured Desulfuromusa sp. TaxID=219183 RepID=UPI002AA661DB|nr:PAS domain S-box protein [uncultured Desulfuromusa sp.]
MRGEPQSLESLQQQISILKTENHQLQQSLQTVKNTSDLYEALVEFAADAILMGDPSGNIIGANQRAAFLSGYSYEELVDMNLSQFFSEEELLKNPLRYDLLKQGEIVRTERLLSRKDGATVPIEMNSRMLPDGTFHSFFRNITERKQADEALRISEEKFSQIFKLSPDAIALTRMEDGLYLDVNDAFVDIIGWSYSEIVGHCSHSADLGIWCHAEDRERMVQALREKGKMNALEADFKDKNGRIIKGSMSARIININNEACVLSITRDISERLKLQEKQKNLEMQMLQVQKLESLGVLAGGIAHDFNNILMAVIGNCDLAQRRLSPTSAAMVNLKQIKLATGKAADLSNQMLAYSGKGKFVVESLNLSRIIEEMQQILSISSSKKASLRYDLNPDIPNIEADVTQVRQIVMNLVINASDAIGDNSGVIAISTGVMECDRNYLQSTWLDENLEGGEYAFIEVADTGCGMTDDMVDRIFEPFYTTKFTGRGLGMAAVLGIIRGHKGAIKIYTEVGKGSTLKVLFPASTLAATKQKIEPESAPLNDHGLVLLIDDEEAVLTISQQMLHEFGFEVVTARDGIEALEVFKQQHQDIRFVLMDLTMPNMDGEEAFREFRRIDPQVKVIICSGYNEQEVSQKFVGKGLAGFLKKPYLLSELQKTIQKLLQ